MLSGVEVAVRWRRDDRQPPDEHPDTAAENWLNEFRPVRPDALTAADADAGGRLTGRTPAGAGQRVGPADRGRRPAPDDRWGLPEELDQRSSGRTSAAPQPRPGPPRADLERDIGPWAGVRPAGGPAPRRDAERADVERESADDADTDPLGQPVRDIERPPARPPLADRWRETGPDQGGEHGGYDGLRSDRNGRALAPDGPGRARDARAAVQPRPDSRRPGPEPSGYQAPNGYPPDRPGLPPGGAEPRRRVPIDGPRPGPDVPSERRARPERPDVTARPNGDSFFAAGRGPGAPGRLPAARPALPPEAARRAPPPEAPRRALPPEAARPAPPPEAARRSDRGALPGHSALGDHGVFPDSGARPDRPRAAGQPLSPPERERRAVPPEAARLAPPPEAAGRSDRGGQADRAGLRDRGTSRDRPRPAGHPLSPPEKDRPVLWPEAQQPLLPLEAAARSALLSEGAKPAPPRPPEPVQPAPTRRDGRPDLVAKLSLADLARVREALALLAEDPAAASGRAAADGDGPVPSAAPDSQQDEVDTFPMPVILPGATAVARPDDAAERPRGPFEPARSSQHDTPAEPEPPADESAASLPPGAAAKLDQIKDLLLTAEAIGEHNLDKHFDQVSQRQRELIRQFFEEAAPGRETSA